tara:strand:- start:615 stop:1007 length:393 start_codon:yes stop_codon:yes gene_type:complete
MCVALKFISETFEKQPKKIIKRQITPIIYAKRRFFTTPLGAFRLSKSINPIIINVGANPLCISSAIFNVSTFEELMIESIKLPEKKMNIKACRKQKKDIIVSVILGLIVKLLVINSKSNIKNILLSTFSV